MPGLVAADGHRPTIQPRVPTHRRQESRSAQTQPSNTLILTSLPPAFFHPSVLNPLRDHVERYGILHTWAPLRSFGRIIIVFHETADAERLRTECDGLEVGNVSSDLKTLRLYRGDPTPLTPPDDESRHLQVPANNKNFLISPPGSPPVGWEPIVEDAPNTESLAADLVAALTRLQDSRFQTLRSSPRSDGKKVLLDTEADDEMAASAAARARPHHVHRHGRSNSQNNLLVLLEDVDASGSRQAGDATPDEVVEVLDARHEMSTSRGGWTPPRGSIGQVKATVDSMRTSRPPIASR